MSAPSRLAEPRLFRQHCLVAGSWIDASDGASRAPTSTRRPPPTQSRGDDAHRWREAAGRSQDADTDHVHELHLTYISSRAISSTLQ